MKKSLPHLHLDRHGTFYFRLTVGGKTIKRSLRTKLPVLANIKAAALNWELSAMGSPKEPTIAEISAAFKAGKVREFDAEFPDGTKITGIESDDDLGRAKELMEKRGELIGRIEPDIHIPRPGRRAAEAPAFHKANPKKFLTAIEPYMKEMELEGVNNKKTREDKESTYAAFAARFDNLRMDAIDKAMAVSFKTHLLKETAAKPGRVNTKIGQLSEFFKWSIGNEDAEANPFEGIRISKKSKLMPTVQSYEPFTEDDLAAIFNPRTYPGYAMKGRPHFRWLPFLLLYTGARPDELASLRLDDVRTEKGIDYIALKAGKNTNSIRKIPLHRVVRASGFMAYLAERRAEEPAGQLFPLLLPSKNGYAKNVARRFNESYLPKLRIDEPTKRLYSFRSTFITRMAELNVHPAMLMALVGHYEQSAVDLSSPHFKNYQGVKRITALRDTMDLFDIVLPMAF